MRNVLSRPEHEILLCIARRELDHERQTRLRQLLKAAVDWNYLFATASQHGLIPLLHKHLYLLDTDPVPVKFRSRLKRHSLANLQNVLHLAGKQLRLYRVLTEDRIPVAIFKGSVLSQMAYGEISLRQAGDIDVLISRSHFHRARQLLESLGYQMAPALTEVQLTSHLASHCEIQFVRDDWFTVVDLHWAMAPKSFVFKLDGDELMTRLQKITIAGCEIETFATEDLVLYLSMHGAKHLWRALEWISSLGELIRSAESIDWDVAIERATQARATRMLGLGLRLVEEVAAVEIPGEVLRATDREGAMKQMVMQIMAFIFTAAGPAASTETNLYNLKVMDRKRDALVSALRALFVPTFTDWSALNLPPSLHPLYYAYRPLRLSKAYSASLWRKLNSRGVA